MRQGNAVLLNFKAFPQCLAELLFVFDHQDPHWISSFFIGDPRIFVY
jgi:hypothetical protein